MTLLVYSLIPLFPFVYVLLRWRQGRDGEPADTQLGLKVALHYFATLGLHLVLMALVAVLYSFLVDDSRGSEQMMRAGGGMLLGGGIILGAHIMLIGRLTDSAGRPNVARMFAGLNLVICGLIGMGALVAGTTMIVQENVPEDGFKLVMVLMAVYLTTWGLQARKLIAYSPRA